MTYRTASPGAAAAALTLALVGLAQLPAVAQAQVDAPSQAQAASQNQAQTSTVDYTRSNQLLGWNLTPLLRGVASEPTFVDGTDRFWYTVRTPVGVEYIWVDPDANSRRPLFDLAGMAAALSVAADTTFDHATLTLTSVEVLDGGSRIRAGVGERWFLCQTSGPACELEEDHRALPDHHILSPNGEWEAFIHDYDLHIMSAGGGDSIRLTTDGEEYFRYGESSPGANQQLRGNRSLPTLEWSPDSRRIAVQRLEERNVAFMPIYSSTPQRPRGFQYKSALPGDSVVPAFDIHVVDVEGRRNVRVDAAPLPIPMSGFFGMDGRSNWRTVRWSPDSQRLWMIHWVRARKRVQLQEVDLNTGRPGPILARDSSDSYVELNLLRQGNPNWLPLGVGAQPGGADVAARGGSGSGTTASGASTSGTAAGGGASPTGYLWFSERDGWAHLYRYDAQGNVVNQITQGPWTFADIIHLDEARGELIFTARGREEGRVPYYRHIYRVGLDGSGLTLLSQEETDHNVHLSPSGRFIVDRYSSPDDAGRTVLRQARTGEVLQELEVADLSLLEQVGWHPPQVISVKARDGVTDLWGLLYTPAGLGDPDAWADREAGEADHRYPIINRIYPGPQIGSVGAWGFSANRGENQALAELGFVVVEIDSYGTPYRSKAFHTHWYGNMGDNGIPDQIAGMKELAARYPFIDIERAGIFGHSGGGFSSTGAILRYPDFFKVAVSGAGNHDNRSYGHYWGEQYQGLLERDTLRNTDTFMNQVNALHAEQLKGKLLLFHGDMDDNVHPAMTMQVVNALIDANKDFDLVIFPDRAHGLNEEYAIRRRWDYFVTHLLGGTPPREYTITRAEN
ncbi:MAG: DPP IV N-terminal domain-containing protein [Gemmatimonadota bacterium]